MLFVSRISDKVKIEDERDQEKEQQKEQSRQQREQKQSLPTNAPVPKVPQIEVSNRAGANQLSRHPLMGFGSSIPINDLMLLRAAEKVAQIRGTELHDKDQEPSAHLQPAAFSSAELFEQEYRRRQHLQLLDLRFQRQMEVVQKIEELQNQAMQQRTPSETPRIRQTALSRRYLAHQNQEYDYLLTRLVTAWVFSIAWITPLLLYTSVFMTCVKYSSTWTINRRTRDAAEDSDEIVELAVSNCSVA